MTVPTHIGESRIGLREMEDSEEGQLLGGVNKSGFSQKVLKINTERLAIEYFSK